MKLNIDVKYVLGAKVYLFNTKDVGKINGYYLSDNRTMYEVATWCDGSRRLDLFEENELAPYTESKKVGFNTGD